MTNRDMVSGAAKLSADKRGAGNVPAPNATPLPPMPAAEDGATPTTREEPIDSPQPNPSVRRDPPSAEKPGLSTER